MTNFVQNIDAAKELCDELIAAGFTPFVSTRSDTISALHKAVRGSDPDASLYWFVRMVDGGVDPRYAARRLVRMASEDIGLADPRALRIALDAARFRQKTGWSPRITLADSLRDTLDFWRSSVRQGARV